MAKKKRSRTVTFSDVHKTFSKWLEIDDPDVLDVTLGTIAGNFLGNNPVWLFLIAPPGGMKSELINAFNNCPSIFPLSDLTPQTLVSGMHGSDKSLLLKLDGKMLTFKDFTTVLSKRPEQINEILSQLREIYDGKFTKSFGTGETVDWEGHVGFIAGCTEVIDSRRLIHSILGERFVLYRVPIGNRASVGMKALLNTNRVAQMRQELSSVMGKYVEKLSRWEGTLPSLSGRQGTLLVELADLTAHGRAAIPRDRFNQNAIEYVPQPESPTRLVQIYAMLAQGIALLYNRRSVTDHEMRIVTKVAKDTMIKSRSNLLSLLSASKNGMDTGAVSDEVGIPSRTTIRHLEDMWALGMLRRDLEGGGSYKLGTTVISMKRGDASYHWHLNDDFKKRIRKTTMFRLYTDEKATKRTRRKAVPRNTTSKKR